MLGGLDTPSVFLEVVGGGVGDLVCGEASARVDVGDIDRGLDLAVAGADRAAALVTREIGLQHLTVSYRFSLRSRPGVRC